MARKLRYNDEEGGMVKAQLMKIENYAAKLNDMIHPDDEIEGWVQAKLAVVAAYMGDVKHYLDYELQQSFADGGGVGGFKPRYWEVEFTWEGEAEGDGRKVNVMADSVAEAEQKVKDKFGMYYKGLKVVEVEEDKEMTWDEYAATKGVKKMADGGEVDERLSMLLDELKKQDIYSFITKDINKIPFVYVGTDEQYIANINIHIDKNGKYQLEINYPDGQDKDKAFKKIEDVLKYLMGNFNLTKSSSVEAFRKSRSYADGGEVMVELKRRGFSNSEAERLVKKHDYLVDVADTAEEAANDIERYDDSENEFPDVPELKFSKGGDTITFPDGYQFKKVSKDFATKNWAKKEIYGLDLESNTEALIENVKDLTRFEVFAEEVGFKEDGGDIEDERELREERREMMERRYEADREEAAIRQLEKRKVKLEDLMRHDDLYFIGNIYDSDTDGWVSKFEAQKIIDKVNAERLEDGGELGLKKNWVLKPVFVQLDKPSDIKLNRVRRQIEDYASQGFRSADILLKMAFLTDEPKLLEDQFQKIKNSIYYQKDIKKYYRGGKMEDEFLKYEGSSFYDDFNEAKQYVGDAVWNDMSYDDKVQATKYLKATGKIGWFGEYEDLETVAASMYKRGGSVGKYLVAVNQKKTNIVSKMLVDSLSDIDRRQYEVLSVKKLG